MARGDIYTMTPGSAVADTIQEILVRRKVEERQAMLDQMNAENMRRGWAQQEAELGLAKNADTRAASADTRAGEAHNETMTRNRIGDLPDELDIEQFKQANPELYGELQKRGQLRVAPGGTPTVSSSYGADDPAVGLEVQEDPTVAGEPLPPREKFVGSKEFQQETRAADKIGALLSNPQFQDPTLQQSLQAQQAGAQVDPSLLGPAPQIRIFDEQRGVLKPGQTIGRNDKVVTQHRPPQFLGQNDLVATDPTDGTGIILDRRNGTLTDSNILVGNRPGTNNTGARGGAPTDLVPVQALNALATAYTVTGPGGYREQAQARSNVAAVARLQNPQAHQFVMQAVEAINRVAAQGRPLPTVEQVMENIESNGVQLNPRDTTDVYRLIFTILNANFQE